MLPALRAVLNHHYRVRTSGDRSPGHDGGGLSTADVGWNPVRLLARLDFADDVEQHGQMCQICRPHSKAIAGRTRKRRKVAIRHNRFGQHTIPSRQQIHRFRCTRRDQPCLLFDHAPRVFKRKDYGIRWRSGHEEIIRQASEGDIPKPLEKLARQLLSQDSWIAGEG